MDSNEIIGTCSHCYKPIRKHENRIRVVEGDNGNDKTRGLYHPKCYWDCV